MVARKKVAHGRLARDEKARSNVAMVVLLERTTCPCNRAAFVIHVPRHFGLRARRGTGGPRATE